MQMVMVDLEFRGETDMRMRQKRPAHAPLINGVVVCAFIRRAWQMAADGRPGLSCGAAL